MRKVILVLVALVLLALAGAGYYVFGDYSDGERGGTVVKLSRKGYVFKTWEGQMNLGMMLGDTPAGAPLATNNLWTFSVAGGDTAVVHALQEAMLSGARVRVRYRQKFVRAPWRGDTDYFVDDVQVEGK